MEAEFFRYQGRLISRNSEEGKELLKWDTPRSQGGMRPDRYEPFPKMLYLANKRPDGVVSVGEADDAIFGAKPGDSPLGAAEQFNLRCQLVVKSEEEMRGALSRGWRNSPEEALARFEDKEKAIGRAAAERHASDAKMSEAAQAEAKKADAATMEHVPEIPEKRRGRRRVA